MPAGSSSELPLSAKAQRLAKEWAQDPQSKVFVPLAEEYAKLGMLQRAAMVLEEGISSYPGYVIAMVALGAVYYEMKELASAKDVLEAAIKSSPENMKAHRLLAQIYAAEGNADAARRSCTVVLMTNPMDEDIKHLERALGGTESPPAAAYPRKQPASTEEEPQAARSGRSTGPDPTLEGGTRIPSQTTVPPPQEIALASLQAKRIARLEKWLAQIQSVRRSL